MKKIPKTHWTHHLLEAGTITRAGDDQLRRLRRIEDLQKQIRELLKEYQQTERELEELATRPDYWTPEEVEEAKRSAIISL